MLAHYAGIAHPEALEISEEYNFLGSCLLSVILCVFLHCFKHLFLLPTLTTSNQPGGGGWEVGSGCLCSSSPGALWAGCAWPENGVV